VPFTLHRGDALTVLRTMPDASVDAVITDPPYNSGGRTSAERTSKTARAKYTSGDAQHPLADFPGDNRDQRSFGYWLTLLLTECYRVTADSGMALVFIDWRQLPTASDALQAAGWIWRGIAPWHKPAARPRKGGLKQDCEFILWGSKGAIDTARHAVYLPGLYTASQPQGRKRVHITQKPVEVMQQLVQICPPGGTVLDPFAGSGSTGVAALREGRSFVGIELSETHFHMARRRLSTESVVVNRSIAR
jgi:site-specific DNA-methyltransferase (adenine-specific)